MSEELGEGKNVKSNFQGSGGIGGNKDKNVWQIRSP